MRVCSEPGCPELSDEARCETHRIEGRRQREARRESPAERGYGPEWRRHSRSFLSGHPICVLCSEPARVADHWPKTRKQLLADGVTDPDLEMFLRPLCTRCHNRETAAGHQGVGYPH